MAKYVGFRSILTCTSSTGTLELAQMRGITGPNTKATDIDTTTMDSSTNYKTFACGPIDPGEVTVKLAYDPAAVTHKRLAYYHGQRLAKTFTAYIGSSTGTSQAFSAYVSSVGREIPMDNLVTCDVGFKVSGKPGFST